MKSRLFRSFAQVSMGMTFFYSNWQVPTEWTLGEEAVGILYIGVIEGTDSTSLYSPRRQGFGRR
jgi:hypothetical protein